jgi:hypothetical protein
MTEKKPGLSYSKKKKTGIGGILRGLSIDDRPDYEEKLQWTCANIHLGKDQLWEANRVSCLVGVGVPVFTQRNSFLLFLPNLLRGQNQFNQWSRLDEADEATNRRMKLP